MDRAPGGGGTRRHTSSRLFLTPLPPAGPITVHCAWPVAGIPETTTVLDGWGLPAAAAGVESLWPVEPGEPPVLVPTPQPDVSPGGWFARTLG